MTAVASMACYTQASAAENSLRAVMHTERDYMMSAIRQALANKDSSPEWAELAAQSEKEVLHWLDHEAVSQWSQYIDYYGSLSESSWPDYWGYTGQLPVMQTSLLGERFIEAGAPWQDYLATFRFTEVGIYPLRALASFYLGQSTPGIPSIAAPAHWQWSWPEQSQKLCLDPASVAENHDPGRWAMSYCVSYLELEDA